MSRRIITWFSSIGVMSLSFEPIRVLLPVYVVIKVGGDAQLTGALFSVSVFWTAVGSLLGGIVADAFGHRRSYLIGLFARVFLAGAFLTTSIPALFVILSIFGLGWGWSDTGFQSYLIQSFPKNRTATLMGFWFSFMEVAAIIGSGVAIVLVEDRGFIPIGILGVLTAVIGFILIWITVPKLPEHTAHLDTGTSDERQPAKLTFSQLFHERGLLAFLGLTGLPTILLGASSVALPLLLFTASESEGLVAGYGLVSAAVALIVQPLLGRLADAKGVWLPIMAGAIIVVIAAVSLAIFPAVLTAIYLAGIAGRLGVGIKDTVTPTIAREVMRPSIHGRVIGLGSMTWSIGFMMGSLLAGTLIDNQAGLLFWIVSGATAGTFPLIYRLLNHARDVQMETA